MLADVLDSPMVSVHVVEHPLVAVRAVAGSGPVDTDLEGRRVPLTSWQRILDRPAPGGLLLLPMYAPHGALVGIVAAEPGDTAASSTRRTIADVITAHTAAMLSARGDVTALTHDRDRLRAREAVLRRMIDARPPRSGTSAVEAVESAAAVGPAGIPGPADAAAIPAQRRPAVATGDDVRDTLSGLLDRRATLRRLTEYIAGERNPARPGAAVYLVLRGLPGPDDAASTDAVLLAISRRIVGVLRKSDTAGRLGNGVFLLIAPDVDEATAHRLADRVRAVIEEPISIHGRSYPVAAGLRVVPLTVATSVADVLNFADPAAMAAARPTNPAESPRTSP